VLNGAIDMAGEDRGNMRCFEAMGCGALLVSDVGNYPPGMEDGQTMQTYRSLEHAPELISACLDNWSQSAETARRGRGRISSLYNKASQLQRFVELVSQI
jgi:spore maturation protein CgeB